MTDILKTKEPSIWSLNQILTLSFFSGPLAGFYLIGKNARILGEKRNIANRFLIGGFLLTTILAGISFFFPVPKIILPLSSAVLTREIASYFYKGKIEDLLKSGRKFSYLKLMLLGLSFLIISILYCAVLFCFLNYIFP